MPNPSFLTPDAIDILLGIATGTSRDPERTKPLLDCSVGRILRRDMDRHGPAGTFDVDMVRHVYDWIEAAVLNREAWLERTDREGRPVKLMKLGSMEQAVREADKAMLKAAQRSAAVVPVEGDETVHEELADGWRLVRMLTPAALDRESAAMQHCIGNGAYDGRLGTAGNLLLSLRDPHGRAHATIEIVNGRLLQLQGKQNRPVSPAYGARVLPFLIREKLAADMAATWIGHVADVDGRWHRIDALPDGVRVDADIDLKRSVVASLPVRMTVRGTLDVSRTGILDLPEGLDVVSLFMDDNPISTLPSDLKVTGYLAIGRTGIERLEPGFGVAGTLGLHPEKHIELPPGTTIGGDLKIRRSGMERLPDGLVVGGDVEIMDGNDLAIGEGTRIGGRLDLGRSGIDRLPADLRVGGGIELPQSVDLTIGPGLHVGGSLAATRSRIAAIPAGTKIGLDLDLSGSAVGSIGRDLTVGGDLILVGSDVSSLPEGTTVGGSIRVDADVDLALPRSIGDDVRMRVGDPGSRSHETTAGRYRRGTAATRPGP